MYKIQKATSEHTDAILALWTKLMSIHKELDKDFFVETLDNFEVYKDNIEFHLSSPFCKVFAAFAEDKLVGYITAEFQKDYISLHNSIPYCEVGDIMIEQDFQKQGLGNALFEEVKKWSVSKDIHTFRLNVFSKNKNALAFFKTLGFDELFHKLELKIN